ncbi:GNAT family N-acetyltransferase [Ornithinimicrobium ciconiae]|uniref:GNAT family N-acetyltransferase n=1 Tax=Ornithinimicrobium ciconiae TaxID=2594265 RepID=A0A516G9D1_9MICO|nr:GNAT family N-acetyltransferase [Ornithinimicrobium ciconiae]QDO88092.1 GNAT family N-acetyltransferase [Ornithinimicrobium ciconiae]
MSSPPGSSPPGARSAFRQSPVRGGVLLRPLASQDVHVFADWAADEEFCRAAEWTVGLSAQQHHAFHTRLMTSPPHDLLRFAAVLNGRLVGTVDLHGDEPDRRELGFLVGPRSRWGQGLGLALARAGVAHGFEELGLREIWAEAYDANRASIRILQELGMTETGLGEVGTYLGQPTRYRQFTVTTAAP